MRSYEAVFIFRPEEDVYTKGLELMKEELKKAEAVVSKEEDLGVRAFAYPIKKENRGHYHCFYIEGNPESISGLNRTIRLTKEVLKHLFVRKDD